MSETIKGQKDAESANGSSLVQIEPPQVREEWTALTVSGDWPADKQERCIHDAARLCTCSAPQSCRFAPRVAPAAPEKRGRTEQVLATRRTGKTDELARRVMGCGCGVVYRTVLKRPTAWQASDYQLVVPEEAAEHLAHEGRYVTAHVIGGGRVVSCRLAAGKLRLELAGTMIADVVLEVRRRPTGTACTARPRP